MSISLGTMSKITPDENISVFASSREKRLHFLGLCYTMNMDCYSTTIPVRKSCQKGAAYIVNIVRSASAGTMESSDVYVEIEPGVNGLEIQLESVVQGQFGDAIRGVVREVLADCGVETASIRIVDRGALDCVIRARVETAVLRGKENA